MICNFRLQGVLAVLEEYLLHLVLLCHVAVLGFTDGLYALLNEDRLVET